MEAIFFASDLFRINDLLLLTDFTKQESVIYNLEVIRNGDELKIIFENIFGNLLNMSPLLPVLWFLRATVLGESKHFLTFAEI